jgi:hypothetical protein
MLPDKTVRLSLMEAASHLQEMMQMIDDGQEIDEYIGQHYLWVDDQATASIDRRKYLLREVEAKVEILKKMQKEVKNHIKKLSKIEENILNTTKQALLINPKASVRDSIGNKVSVCSGPKKLNVSVVTGERTIKNLLTDEQVENLFIMGFGGYVSTATAQVLDVESIRKDLEDGRDLSGFAVLEDNFYVRGL